MSLCTLFLVTKEQPGSLQKTTFLEPGLDSSSSDYISALRNLLLSPMLSYQALADLTSSEVTAALGFDRGSLENVAHIAGVPLEAIKLASEFDPSCLVSDVVALFRRFDAAQSVCQIWSNARCTMGSLRAHLAYCSNDLQLLAALSEIMHISDAVVSHRVLSGLDTPKVI